MRTLFEKREKRREKREKMSSEQLAMSNEKRDEGKGESHCR
jgi:hypothetical protein